MPALRLGETFEEAFGICIGGGNQQRRSRLRDGRRRGGLWLLWRRPASALNTERYIVKMKTNMRKALFQVLMLSAAVTLFATGCIDSQRAWVREPGTLAAPAGEVVVTETPPPPHRDTFGAPPDASRAWVDGCWSSSNGKWVWIHGHWELRPRPAAAWVPGHWDKNIDRPGWTLTPGPWD
jgi:hypothetical protein